MTWADNPDLLLSRLMRCADIRAITDQHDLFTGRIHGKMMLDIILRDMNGVGIGEIEFPVDRDALVLAEDAITAAVRAYEIGLTVANNNGSAKLER